MENSRNKGKNTLKNAGEKRKVTAFSLSTSDLAYLKELSDTFGLSMSSTLSLLLENAKKPETFKSMSQWLNDYAIKRGFNVKKRPVSFNSSPASAAHLGDACEAIYDNQPKKLPKNYSQDVKTFDGHYQNRYYTKSISNFSDAASDSGTAFVYDTTGKPHKVRLSERDVINLGDVPLSVYDTIDGEYGRASTETRTQCAEALLEGSATLKVDSVGGIIRFLGVSTITRKPNDAKDQGQPMTDEEFHAMMSSLYTTPKGATDAEDAMTDEQFRKSIQDLKNKMAGGGNDGGAKSTATASAKEPKDSDLF